MEAGVRQRCAAPWSFGGQVLVLLDLDFDTQEVAAEFLSRLQTDLWKGNLLSQALTGAPTTQIIETVAIGTPAVP